MGIRTYHPVDTLLSYDLKLFAELYRSTADLMHVSLSTGKRFDLPQHHMYQSEEVTPRKASLACQWLNLDR